jgi:D-glycero-D-manno-heptose 1,7-bisphosphate phosphatase
VGIIGSEALTRTGVILDRDGVLLATEVRDGKPRAVATLAECRLLPEVPAAITRLRARGLPLAIVTNQPDAADDEARRADVDSINEHLTSTLGIDTILVCYHTDKDKCDCRKPKTGLLCEAAAALGFDLHASFMVGDRWRDISAGAAAGCTTILVGDGYGERFPDLPDYRASNLGEAADIILKRLASGGGEP